MQLSQEYIGSLAIVIVSVLKMFNITIGNDVISSLIVAVVGIWVAIRRHQRGDISVAGVRKA